MSYPSDEEKHLITKFRTRVFDILKPGEDRSDQFLVRWIRAQDGNLEKAELMIRKSFDWRREKGVDDIIYGELDPFFFQNFPYYLHGTDTLGHPIMEVPLGSWDLCKVVAANREEDFLLHITQLLERMMDKIRESNRGRKPWEFQNTQITTIVDWAGYSYPQLVNFKAVQLILKFASYFEANYPETLYKAFYINCPAIFSKLYGMLKPIFRESTVARLKVYGTNRAEWEPKLKRLIHTDQLSSLYGGNVVVPSISHIPSFPNLPFDYQESQHNSQLE